MSTTSKKIVAGLVTLAALLSTSAFGATIQTFPNFCSSGEKGVDCYLVTINGSIVPGDFEKFEAELKRIDRANPKDGWYGLVGLQSDGGNPVEAMNIGRLIRKRKLPTYVGSNMFCVSACAMIWVAGSNLQAEPTAKVGFHAAYLVDQKKRFIKEYGAANALIGAYYSELGYSARAIFYMTSAAPNQMAWLKTEEGLKMGFNITTQQPAAAPKKTQDRIEPGSRQAATTPRQPGLDRR